MLASEHVKQVLALIEKHGDRHMAIGLDGGGMWGMFLLGDVEADTMTPHPATTCTIKEGDPREEGTPVFVVDYLF